MKNFGETLRNLRLAQDMGLRETALRVGISAAYLSRIERGKEHPPKPETIKALAKTLAADPDVLFRLSSSTDPEISGFINENPKVAELVRLIIKSELPDEQIDRVLGFVKAELLPKEQSE
jgi:transcriptional regulator with XRE-family HTH domain